MKRLHFALASVSPASGRICSMKYIYTASLKPAKLHNCECISNFSTGMCLKSVSQGKTKSPLQSVDKQTMVGARVEGSS